MAISVIETISVRRLEILDQFGNVDAELMPPLGEGELRRMYELLVLTRVFDQRALSLQREGRLGTYPSVLGQEAAQVGSAFPLRASDWLFPSFREMGMHLTLGYPPHLIFQYWSGDVRGLKTPDHLNIFPICVSVGAQILHATGAAMGARARRDGNAIVACFGDGATSKGDFHEAFNMAGVYRLPIVFICQNNQWAISVPLKGQTASATLAQKAQAYGFEGIQVDGNDIFAVYRAVSEALDKARSGDGPTFIECLTYRIADHTTADDASRYRKKAEVDSWRERDPILRLRRYLDRNGWWSEQFEQATQESALRSIDEAVRAMETAPPPEAAELFSTSCASPGKRLARQRDMLTRTTT